MSYLPQIVGFVLLVAASAAAGLIMLGLFLLVSKIAERPIQELEVALSGMRAELREMHMPRWQMAAHVGVMLMVVAVFVAVASAADSAAFGLAAAAVPIVAFQIGRRFVRVLRDAVGKLA